MRIGVVLVHYYTPLLARSAVKSLLDDAAGSGLDLHVVIVDNGNTAEGRRMLEAFGDARVVDPGENLGYAGAFNLGVQELRECDVFAVMNPDVRVFPGCLRALTSSLAAGVGVVGPRFWWDRRGGFQLPPTEERGRLHSVRRFLSARRQSRSARVAWRRHARRHWSAHEPVPSLSLSGALLAIEKSAWRHVGPFDDGYRLYFEETDWLERARRAGVKGRFVPAAEARHEYAQSTVREPRAAQWFLESHQRFRRLHYGWLFTAGLGAADRFLRPKAPPADPSGGPTPEELADAEWLEVAASPSGFPAAGVHLGRQVVRPGPGPEVPIPQGRYWVRGLRGDTELWTYSLEAARGPGA